jgi:hypothetical protein
MPNKRKSYKGSQRHIDKTIAPLNRSTLQNCPTTRQAPRITKYQGSTFKKECDVDTTLLPGPKWT